MSVLVLAVDPPVPPTSGARLRSLHLARELTRDDDVEVVALGQVPGAVDEPFRLRSGGRFRPRSVALALSVWQPYQAAKLGTSALGRLASTSAAATVQAPLFLLPAALEAGVPTVLDAYDVESEAARSLADVETGRVRRARRRWETAKTARFERLVVPRATAVCAASDADAGHLAAMGARRVVVVPNGVDTTALAFVPPGPFSATLLYVGTYGYLPNVDAARVLAREVLPAVRAQVPEASVRIVGREGERVADLAAPGVTVVGEVDSVEPELRRASALVVPLRAGSGTRLKVLEAMAAGVPVVATPLAVAGLDVKDGEDVLLAPDPAGLAAQVVRLAADAALGASLAAHARRVVEERYAWSTVARPLVDLHRELARR